LLPVRHPDHCHPVGELPRRRAARRPGPKSAGARMTEPLLDVADLSVTFQTREGQVQAIRNLSFTLQPGETLGIVGESGSGKSTVALSILGLLPKNARITGSVRTKGRELIGLSEQSLS